jgi:hypothetical protein
MEVSSVFCTRYSRTWSDDIDLSSYLLSFK